MCICGTLRGGLVVDLTVLRSWLDVMIEESFPT